MSIYREHVAPIESQEDFMLRLQKEAEEQIARSVVGNTKEIVGGSGFANADIFRALAMAPMGVVIP